MVSFNREGLRLLFKLGRALVESEQDTSEEPESTTEAAPNAEQMKAYWESDKKELKKKERSFVDLFMKDVSLGRIPDTTAEPVKESRYNFEQLSLVYLPDALKNFEGNVSKFKFGYLFNVPLFLFFVFV